MNIDGLFAGVKPALVLVCLVQGATMQSVNAQTADALSTNKLGAIAIVDDKQESELETLRSRMLERRKVFAQKAQERREARLTAWKQMREKWAERRQKAVERRAARLQNIKKRDGTARKSVTTAATIPQKSPADAVKANQTKTSPKGKFGSLIAKYAKQNGIPYSLARAVVQVESSFRANVTGQAGEIGLMQIKLATARGMGYKGSRKGLYDPATNLFWGMKYLGKAHKLAGGSTCGTILRYNAGHGAKKMNPISARYCKRVKGILA